MRINGICTKSFGAMNFPARTISRKSLNAGNSQLKALAGAYEKGKARAWVIAYTAGNSALAGATAQAGGLEEFLLSGVEVAMAAHIFNGIYDFKLSKTALKSLAAGVAGHAVGKTTFKLASKSLTWIPGLGNLLNAGVAGTTTAALGFALVEMAEDMERSMRNGKRMEDFLNEMEKK